MTALQSEMAYVQSLGAEEGSDGLFDISCIVLWKSKVWVKKKIMSLSACTYYN